MQDDGRPSFWTHHSVRFYQGRRWVTCVSRWQDRLAIVWVMDSNEHVIADHTFRYRRPRH